MAELATNLKLVSKIYRADPAAPEEFIRRVTREKLTGALTLRFVQGGLCKQVEWREGASAKLQAGDDVG